MIPRSRYPFVISSLGKKIIMAITGILLFGFLVGHMLGNLQIFLGEDTINGYAELLQNLGLILWLVRFGLLAIFIVHIIVSYQLTVENNAARPQAYYLKKRIKANWASGYMGVLGSFILFYLVFHLMHFTFGLIHSSYYKQVDGFGRHDVYYMIIKSFQDLPTALFYIIMMIALCAHLWHGVPSFFQTLGLRQKKITAYIETFSPLVAIVIAAGYVAVPLAVVTGIIH